MKPKSDRLEHALTFAKKNDLVAGHVYLVQCNEFTKIGFAYDVPARVCNLQIGCPYELKLLGTIACLDPVVVEEELHAIAERYRVRGEWFKLPPEMLAGFVLRFKG